MANGVVEKKVVEISGICTNCNSRETCDFIKNIKSYIKDNKCSRNISDVDISVYSCGDYESEISIICDDDSICIDCHREG